MAAIKKTNIGKIKLFPGEPRVRFHRSLKLRDRELNLKA